MNRFVSTFTMRLDAKGRISIPASFRAVLARDGFEGLYCHPALDRPALDAGGNALLSEIETLKPDSEGRIILSEHLKSHAGVKDAASFVGLGHKFQIWEPERLRAHLAEANEKIRALKKTLGSSGAGEPSGASG
jgi:MraZ protein